MPSRALRILAALALLAGFSLGVACFVLGLQTESTAGRMADGALVLIDLACMTGLTFVILPRRA